MSGDESVDFWELPFVSHDISCVSHDKDFNCEVIKNRVSNEVVEAGNPKI